MTANSLFNVTGKTALITGGSRGLGLQIAEALGRPGSRLVLSARKAYAPQRAQAHLHVLDTIADGMTADLTEAADVGLLCDAALEKLGRVDILVNNAGASWGAPA